MPSAASRCSGRSGAKPAVDRERLVDVLVGLSALAGDRGDIAAVDLNPLIVEQGRPIAVDALVELDA